MASKKVKENYKKHYDIQREIWKRRVKKEEGIVKWRTEEFYQKEYRAQKK
jgi:hypothetical protein